MTIINSWKKIALVALGTGCLTATLNLKSSQVSANQVQNNQNIFNWYDLWDTGSTETNRTFTNVNNSGVDVTVEYSTGQKWQQDENRTGLNLYDKYSPKKSYLNHGHPLWIYHGILRFTNNQQDTGNNSAWVKMTFSEPVTIGQLWAGSLSVHRNVTREWMKVSGYSSDNIAMDNLDAYSNSLVAPSKVDDYQDFFNTTCNNVTLNDNAEGDLCNIAGADDPSYVDILPNQDGSVTLKGLGNSDYQKFGRTFFEYDTPVQTIIFQHYITEKDNDNQRSGDYTSVAISPDISFVPATTPTNSPAPKIYAD